MGFSEVFEWAQGRGGDSVGEPGVDDVVEARAEEVGVVEAGEQEAVVVEGGGGDPLVEELGGEGEGVIDMDLDRAEW